jgi:hypothetical protein
LAVRSPQERIRLAKEVESGNLTVRQIESRGTKPAAAIKRDPKRGDANLAELSDEIQAALGMRVRITGTPRRGAITVSYHAPAELARLHQLLMKAAAGERDDHADAESDQITV